MERNQLQRLAPPNAQPRAFVYRNADSTAELPHPLRRSSDVRALPSRAVAASAQLQFRVYLKP